MHVTVAASIGLGLIGASWAAAFATCTQRVYVYDPDQAARRRGMEAINAALRTLERTRGIDAAAAYGRVVETDSLAQAVEASDYVQESAPERLELKRALFDELDACAQPNAMLASSTSELQPQAFLEGRAGGSRMLIAHPLNPPHLIPAVELCGSRDTDPAILQRAAQFLRRCGNSPLMLRRPKKGFVMNRLQLAVIREALHLVAEGVCSPHDVDLAMRDGLARRWAAIGPFAVNRLSTRSGYAYFLEAYGETLRSIVQDLDASFDFPASLGQSIDAAMGGRLSDAEFETCTSERDSRLVALSKLLDAGKNREGA